MAVGRAFRPSIKHRSCAALMTEMPMNFLKYYITRRHFTGGVMGLRYAAIQSWYRFLKIYRVWRERMFGGRAFTVGQAPNERRETASTQDDGIAAQRWRV